MDIYQELWHIDLYISDSSFYGIESGSMHWDHGRWELCDREPGEIRGEIRLEDRRTIFIYFYLPDIDRLHSCDSTMCNHDLLFDIYRIDDDTDLLSCFSYCCFSEELAIIELATRECPKTRPYLGCIWSLYEEDLWSMTDDEAGSSRDERTRHSWLLLFQGLLSPSLRSMKQSSPQSPFPLNFLRPFSILLVPKVSKALGEEKLARFAHLFSFFHLTQTVPSPQTPLSSLSSARNYRN